MRIIRSLVLICVAFLTVSARVSAADLYNGYQWSGDRGDWYEWWYYKVVVPGTNQAFFFVYGIVNPWDANSERPSSGSYVSMGHFGEREVWKQQYPIVEFQAQRSDASVKVGPNMANASHIQGAITNEQGETVSWDLNVEKEWAFNAMGWTTGLRGISNIYWYPAQASARMTGTITYKGQHIQIENAPAYQDRNWGRSLPDWWVWIVSNHFENSPGSTLAVGGGRPHFLERYSIKDGITIGLHHAGKEYVFRSPDGDSIRTQIKFGQWEVQAVNKRNQKIVISAYAPREKFMRLVFISPRGENFNDYEALQGDLRVELFERAWVGQAWKSVGILTSHEAGIEYGSFDEFDIGDLFSREIELN